MTLMARDSLLPWRQLSFVFPWPKPLVTQPDLLRLQPLFVCERAWSWEKPPVKHSLTRMRYYLPMPSSRISCATGVLSPLALDPVWAIDLARCKLLQIQLHKAELRFLWS